MELRRQEYGKARVRVLKVTRGARQHTIKEVEVKVSLEGDFGVAYTAEDNSRVLPTDTMKNTVHALAREHLGEQLECFGVVLGRHFLKRYPQVRQVAIHLVERPWQRLRVAGKPHAHTFLGNAQERPFARVISSRRQVTVEAGIEDLLILKSTGSGFSGFPKCEYTTLAETDDRILATSMKATWVYRITPRDYGRTNRRILDAMLSVFAVNYSPSVQATLYQMAEAALNAAPEISEVSLKLPNKHYLLVNLKPFGLENPNEIFVPTDEPHGQIEATVSRD
jgi:urate oxidase